MQHPPATVGKRAVRIPLECWLLNNDISARSCFVSFKINMNTFHCKSVSLFSTGKILNAYILYQSFHLGYIFKTSVAQRARWIITQIVLHFSDKLFKDKVRSFHDTLFPVFESCNNVSKCFMSYYNYFIDFIIYYICNYVWFFSIFFFTSAILSSRSRVSQTL